MKTKDTLQPFSFVLANYRGTRVVLQQSYQDMISTVDYPNVIKKLLGESLAAVALMSSSLKIEGRISLQLQRGKKLPLLFVEITDNGNVRGLAQYSDDLNDQDDFQEIIDGGTLVVNIIPQKGNSYQGVVSLQGKNLATCLNEYFKQSEQLLTGFWLFSDNEFAAGIMLQAFPDATDSDLLLWQELALLLNTVSEEEMMTLDHQTLLHRVFAEHDLNLFDNKDILFKCPCSKEKALGSILMLSHEEIHDLFQKQKFICSHCDFCNTEYEFDEDQIYQAIMANHNQNKTQH